MCNRLEKCVQKSKRFLTLASDHSGTLTVAVLAQQTGAAFDRAVLVALTVVLGDLTWKKWELDSVRFIKLEFAEETTLKVLGAFSKVHLVWSSVGSWW